MSEFTVCIGPNRPTKPTKDQVTTSFVNKEITEEVKNYAYKLIDAIEEANLWEWFFTNDPYNGFGYYYSYLGCEHENTVYLRRLLDEDKIECMVYSMLRKFASAMECLQDIIIDEGVSFYSSGRIEQRVLIKKARTDSDGEFYDVCCFNGACSLCWHSDYGCDSCDGGWSCYGDFSDRDLDEYENEDEKFAEVKMGEIAFATHLKSRKKKHCRLQRTQQQKKAVVIRTQKTNKNRIQRAKFDRDVKSARKELRGMRISAD